MNMTDLKPGVRIEHKGEPHEVLTSSFSRSSQSKGFMTTRLKNMISGNTIEVVFRDKETIIPIQIERKKSQFLYKEGSNYVFMDNESFDQFEIGEKVLGDKWGLIKEGEEVSIVFYEERPIGIDLPAKVVLKVVEADPGIKGATASDVKKSAVLETGMKIQVPSFVNEGDSIRVNTERGDYVERV